MDIRIEKTDRAIEKAFLELRSKMPLEKIKIKDLCTLACVNKSTFYAHYEDIYALSSRLEDKLIADILASVSAVELHPVRTEALTRELFRAFVQNKTAVNILFADTRIVEGSIYGHMVIDLPSDPQQFHDVLRWLDHNHISYLQEDGSHV